MFASRKRRYVSALFILAFIATAALLGTALGLSVGINKNTAMMDELNSSRPAIPSRIMDINGDLITEFFSEENRDIVPITSLPENLLYATLTREDSSFFRHTGFSIEGFFRALYRTSIYIVTGKGSLQGASTITMQLAGNRHADRSEISIKRKLTELWWAYQFERRFTKHEILEQYLNTVYFGHNNYGVEAASQFFFGHSAVENSPAESVILIIQLAGTGIYSPLIKPNVARFRQKEILQQMVLAGYVSAKDADRSFETYWNDFDWSRSPSDSSYFDRLSQDRAPYFSEYIRSQVEQYLYGQQNIYRDGYTIHTTLNLAYQDEAQKEIDKGLIQWNKAYQNNRAVKTSNSNQELVSMIDIISIAFDIPGIHVRDSQERRLAMEYFESDVTPLTDMISMAFGITDLKTLSSVAYERVKMRNQKNKVETALITLDNRTGYILAMVGGSQFNRNNQFNRAVSAKLMPGSAFKPLYYSAAISSGKFTTATRIYDGPEAFTSPDGTPYVPENYNGKWEGSVLLRNALAKSMNIPALKVLNSIGFDAAINRAAELLGITDPREIGETFERVYPLGLGILSITPLQIARAYAVFGNQGRDVNPFAIRYIEDRDGNIIVNPEQDLLNLQERRNMQIISPQTAYIMTNLLQSSLAYGTLSYARRTVDGFDGMPISGKTGTTQNWTDAWTLGFSPYYTTALWIGFDRRGNSLGQNQTGATATGPVWAKYMKSIHKDLPRIPFQRPETGIVNEEIDIRTGELPERGTPETLRREEIFIAGTEPKTTGNLIRFERKQAEEQAIKFAGDSSRVNLEKDNSANAVFIRNLFDELDLNPQQLQGKNSPRSSTPRRPSNSSILD